MKRILLLLAIAACSSGKPRGDDDHDDGGVPPVTPDAALPSCTPTSAGTFTYEKIATWRDDAKAAYSIIHDDLCDDTVQGVITNAVPALDSYGIGVGMGAIAGECEDSDRWSELVDLEAHGHEIVNHSWSHVNVTPENGAQEIVAAKKALDAHIAHPVTFYIYPYDFFTDASIAAVQAAGHLGSRGGNRDDNDGLVMPPINGPNPDNDLRIEFDVWPRSYSKYALFYPDDMLAVHVWNAIDAGGWAMREFHSVIQDGQDVTGQGFGPIELTPYKKHLQFLADARKKGVLWTAPPTAVLRYRHARTACKASVSGDQITFDTSNADCTKYATPVSVIVTTADDVPRVDGTQDGAPVATIKLGPKRFSIDADPTKGAVALTACSNDGYAIDPSVSLAPKPTPANSVCDIETVHGTGSPGKMDDLERPVEEFQALPNPSQADGRTGTWSWYPQSAVVAIAADGSNHYLHYTGSGINAWSGATLAFLGGNGAGSCYDGTKYKGIRFKIKGTVTATDELNGKVNVSIVTSETQGRRYGGDLDGEGGHFHKVVSVTPTWTTVEIPWESLDKPTWGMTTSLTAVAKTKLQAIDFGVSNTATWDLAIDDIELY
ncbi:MAG TPA: polysaccharide deacetylase family protein [Kofleriaceae bacterium]|nr:polysaccharide deacetylase family protein [Kofleriaceae bacterium]